MKYVQRAFDKCLTCVKNINMYFGNYSTYIKTVHLYIKNSQCAFDKFFNMYQDKCLTCFKKVFNVYSENVQCVLKSMITQKSAK